MVGRRELLLARMAVLGFRLGLDLRCALRHIDDDLSLIVLVVWFCGIAEWGHATSFFAWVSRRRVYLASQACHYLRPPRMGVLVRAFRRRCDDDLLLPLSLKDVARVFLRRRRAATSHKAVLELVLRLTPLRPR